MSAGPSGLRLVAAVVGVALALVAMPPVSAAGDLKTALIHPADLPAGFSSPAVKTYSRFTGTVSVEVSPKVKVRQCLVPSYYPPWGWTQGMFEVVPYKSGQYPFYDVSLCGSLFRTVRGAHVAFQGNVSVVKQAMVSPAARKIHEILLTTAHVGNESIAWQASSTAGPCYWLWFRRGNAVIELAAGCGVVNLGRFVQLAQLTSSRLH